MTVAAHSSGNSQRIMWPVGSQRSSASGRAAARRVDGWTGENVALAADHQRRHGDLAEPAAGVMLLTGPGAGGQPALGLSRHRARRQQIELLVATDLAHELDVGAEQRGDHRSVAQLLGRFLHLAGDRQRHARGPGHGDRRVHALVRAHASEEQGNGPGPTRAARSWPRR